MFGLFDLFTLAAALQRTQLLANVPGVGMCSWFSAPAKAVFAAVGGARTLTQCAMESTVVANSGAAHCARARHLACGHMLCLVT